MQYPRLTKEQRKEARTMAVNERDVQRMRALRAAKVPLPMIAKVIGCSRACVQYWTSESYRRMHLEFSLRKNAEHPDRHLAWKKQSQKKLYRRRMQEPAFRTYHRTTAQERMRVLRAKRKGVTPQ